MSLLGIIASSKLSAAGDFESIATAAVTSNTTFVEFTSIPQTYTHLQIRYIARTNRNQYTSDVMAMQLNGDTSALYNHHQFDGTGSIVESGSSASGQTSSRVARPAASGAPENTFSAGIIDILDYKNTNKNHVIRSFCGVDVNGDYGGNGAGIISLFSALHRSTTAISSIKLFVIVTESQFSFIPNSHFALYGIKGAQPMAITYEPIATTTVSTATASVTFSSISGSYTDLIVVFAGTAGGGNNNLVLTFNSDTGNNYSWTDLEGNGSTAASYRLSNQAGIKFAYNYVATGTSQCNTIMHIMNYSNTTTYKTALGRVNTPTNATIYVGTTAGVGLWRNTAAITSLTCSNGDNWASGSTFSLYGIKSAQRLERN